MKYIFLILGLFYSLNTIAEVKDTRKVANQKVPPYVETAYYKIIHPNEENFKLSKGYFDSNAKERVHYLIFSRGERIIKSFPIREKDFQDWAKQINEINQSKKDSSCPHPLKIAIQLEKQKPQENELCSPNQQTQDRIQKLIKEFTEYLYGK